MPLAPNLSKTLPRSFRDKAKVDKIQSRPLPSVPQGNGSATDSPAPQAASPSLSKRDSLLRQQGNQRPIPVTRKKGTPLPPLPGSCDSSGSGGKRLHAGLHSSPLHSVASPSEKHPTSPGTMPRRHPSIGTHMKKPATEGKKPPVSCHSQNELQGIPTVKPSRMAPAPPPLRTCPQPSVPTRDTKPLSVKEETRHLLENGDLSRPPVHDNNDHIKPSLPEKDNCPTPLLPNRDKRPRPPLPDKDDSSRPPPLSIKDDHGSPTVSNKVDRALGHTNATSKPMTSPPPSQKSRGKPKVIEYEDVPQFKDRKSVDPPKKNLAQSQNDLLKDQLYLVPRKQTPSAPPAKSAPALPEKDTVTSSGARVPPPLPEKENPPPPPRRSAETHLSYPPAPPPSTTSPPPPPPPVIPPSSSLRTFTTPRPLSVSAPPLPPPSDPSTGRPFSANDLVNGFNHLKKVENGPENRRGTISSSFKGGMEETFHRALADKFCNVGSDSEEEFEDVDDDEWDD